MRRIKCYIYGAGNEYNKFCSYLPLYEDKIEILGVITTEWQGFSKIDGFPWIRLEEIEKTEWDYVIVAVQNWKEIAEILVKHGISKQKIIRSRSFYYPFFDLEDYLELKTNPVSILSNFCWGGMVYQDLGLEMNSPTIDMFCLGMNYIGFLNDYRHYLQIDMTPYYARGDKSRYIQGTLGNEAFMPKGIIDSEILWYFNHSSNAEGTVKKWNERRKRVHLENVAVLMIMNSDEEAYAFETVAIPRKIGLYYKDLSLPHVIYCPDWCSDENLRQQYGYCWFWFADIYGLNKINWLKFLTGKKDYLRY